MNVNKILLVKLNPAAVILKIERQRRTDSEKWKVLYQKLQFHIGFMVPFL